MTPFLSRVTMSFRLAEVFLILLLAFNLSAQAQTVSASLTKAEAVKTGMTTWAVDLNFDTDFNAADVSNTHFKLVNVDGLSEVAIVRLEGIPTPGETRRSLRLHVNASVPLPTIGHYHVFVYDMTFEGIKPKAEIQLPVTLPPATAAVIPATDTLPSVKKPKRSLESADGKDDSNFYLAGELNTSKGSKGTGSVEGKVEYSYHKDYFGRTNKISPFLDLNASTDANADPDSLNFGVHWLMPAKRRTFSNKTQRDRRNQYRLYIENTGKIEAEHDFDSANALWQGRFLYPMPLINREKVALYFEPYAGSELGGNIVSPVAEARHRLIARALAGTNMLLIFRFPETAALENISFEGAFVRRWPLHDEITFRADDDGKIFALPLGKSPRDYVQTKLNFNWAKFFGIFVGYEWGELPPSYKLVNHKLKIGFVYKSKFK